MVDARVVDGLERLPLVNGRALVEDSCLDEVRRVFSGLGEMIVEKSTGVCSDAGVDVGDVDLHLLDLEDGFGRGCFDVSNQFEVLDAVLDGPLDLV